MSHQPTLQAFYKCKASPPPGVMCNNNNTRKRRNLSLIKPATPKKCPKSTLDGSVIDLVSDDENSVTEDLNSSNSSLKSVSSNSNVEKVSAPSTPRKSAVSSPKKDKFFSPVKKRAVFKTPVKRGLARELNGVSPKKLAPQDEELSKACEGMDDKSVFLLTMINNFLKHDNLQQLLDENSIQLLSQCLHITKPGIRLLCRLYWRQHIWYREEQLVKICSDKKENAVDNFQDMINSLVENGVIVASSTAGQETMSFEELVKILKSDELKQISKDLKIKIQVKQDAVEALRKFSKQTSISKYFMGSNNTTDNSKRVMQIMRTKAGTCYKLTDAAIMSLYKVYLLMYLGMDYSIIRDKKLELTLINNKIKSETYPGLDVEVDDAGIVFRSRDEFIRYLKAQIIYENYLSEPKWCEKCLMVRDVFRRYQAVNEEDLKRYKDLPTWLRRYTPPYLYVKILETGIQELKKEKCNESYQLAVDILSTLIDQSMFRQHKKAEWIAEKALVLHKLMVKHDEAAEVLIEGLKSDLSEEQKDVMRPRALKIANQLNITLRNDLEQELIELSRDELILENSFTAEHVMKQHMENPGAQRGKRKFVVDTGKGKIYLDAEEYCVYHYTSNGTYTDGHHWEGRIITTIFFLLFWDIIYTKPRGVPGIFLSHFQMYPLDMFCEGFYENRKDLIDERLRSIESMNIDGVIDMMHQTWKARPEHELSSINRQISWEDISAVTSCLGSGHVATVCSRLARNYRNTSGFPDLTMWNTDTGKIKFVEVKTDSDKPSRKQLQWMQYLKDNGIDTGFCYVGVTTMRCKARAPETKDIEENEAPRTPSKSPITPTKSRTPNRTPKTPRKGTPGTPNKSQMRKDKAKTPDMANKVNDTHSRAPIKVPRSPNKAPGTPNKAPGTPNKAPSTPTKSPGTPNKAPSTPNKLPGTPNKAPSTPTKSPGTPNKAPSTPNKLPGTPNKAPSTPTKSPGTPNKAPSTTYKLPSTSNKAPSSPNKASGTPNKAPGTPNKSPTIHKTLRTPEKDGIFASPKKPRNRPKINVRSVADINKAAKIL